VCVCVCVWKLALT